MSESDIEVLGAVQDIITEQSTLDLISPPLEIAETDRFLAVYFERCIRENPQGEWGLSRYMAAHQLNRWFLDLWNERPKSEPFLKCTSFVRDCLKECGLPAGGYTGPRPQPFFNGLPNQ